MHFIEELFGISPDGGNGLLELSLLFAPVLALGIYYWIRKRSRAIHSVRVKDRDV
jgi:hypothetical protein